MFKDRFEAGEKLALLLEGYANTKDTLVLALPRGGLQVGYTLAKRLGVPLDAFFSKKIGAPGNPELAIGAVTLTQQFIDPMYQENPAFKEYLAEQIKAIRALLKQRSSYYYQAKKPLSVQNKIIILTDDGAATGYTLLAAVRSLKKEKPRKIIIALPVASPDTMRLFKNEADELVCLLTPHNFLGVGQFYASFTQVEDAEAKSLLEKK